jgi:hypothetical protein
MKSYLDFLFWDSRQVELRCQLGGHWVTGWFDSVDTLRAAALARQDQGNLYTSLHRPVERMVINAMSGSPLVGDEVERYTRLFFDFDPERETCTAATDEQVGLAKARSEEVQKVLRLMGWPEPLVAMSGNGYHLQYRIALPNDAETRERLRTLYQGLANEFSDDLVKFDPKVRNAARICTLYGSIKRKGAARSLHRRSQAWIPRDWRQVRPRHFDVVVEFYARQQKTVEADHRPAVKIDGDGDYSTLDVVRWFQVHGQYHKPTGDHGKHFVRCPWESEHSDGIDAQVTDTVVWEAEGNWPTFHCSHAHCEGRTIRDVLQVWGDADQFCGQAWRVKS